MQHPIPQGDGAYKFIIIIIIYINLYYLLILVIYLFHIHMQKFINFIIFLHFSRFKKHPLQLSLFFFYIRLILNLNYNS